ncbi:MAG TPA: DUF484 family protein [Gammaproteobacteria bacterium]|jgi:uncharacterized protein YigA (DUF484 family)
MTTSQPTQAVSETVTEESVERYLKDHPGFFECRPQLLTTMKVQHPTTGQTVSLIERQVTVLREQNHSLEKKLMELVEIARENERLSRQLHSFSSELLKARTLPEVIATTQDKVREIFQTDFVALCLLKDTGDGTGRENCDKLFTEIFAGDTPVCGSINAEQIRFLFQGNAAEVASAAVVPLRTTDAIGLLGLASRDAQRFIPGMGHLFLSHLGDLVCSALAAHVQ